MDGWVTKSGNISGSSNFHVWTWIPNSKISHMFWSNWSVLTNFLNYFFLCNCLLEVLLHHHHQPTNPKLAESNTLTQVQSSAISKSSNQNLILFFPWTANLSKDIYICSKSNFCIAFFSWIWNVKKNYEVFYSLLVIRVYYIMNYSLKKLVKFGEVKKYLVFHNLWFKLFYDILNGMIICLSWF